jgi:hypothetical protein
MSNESKYYTPTIDQFRVGFRYELGELMEDNSKNWHKRVFSTADDQMSLGAIENLIKGGYIRVKVLDEADIMECGWELTKKYFANDGAVFYENNDHVLLIDRGWVSIFNRHNELDIFKGKVRNYNELKDVMRMLEIEVK